MIAIVLMVFTMVLHPTGGSIEHLQRISTLIMTTHSIAILSVPFWLPGFLELTKLLEDGGFFSRMALALQVVGLFAVVMAATLNGLALPLFVNHYKDASPATIQSIKPIVTYNTALNHGFDLVFIGASTLAILGWSVAILNTRRLPLRAGWFGIAVTLAIVVTMTSGFSLTDLTGFRVFVTGFAVWVVVMIVVCRKENDKVLEKRKEI